MDNTGTLATTVFRLGQRILQGCKRRKAQSFDDFRLPRTGDKYSAKVFRRKRASVKELEGMSSMKSEPSTVVVDKFRTVREVI